MNGLSSWAMSVPAFWNKPARESLFESKRGNYSFFISRADDALWITSMKYKGCCIYFRAVYDATKSLRTKKVRTIKNGIEIRMTSNQGSYLVNIAVSDETEPLLRYTTQFTPAVDLLVPFIPRDIVVAAKNRKTANTFGTIYARQEGTRSGMIYFSCTKPGSGSILYLQNLTSLADYCQQTGTSCAEVVGGSWPELGFLLPASQDKPLKAGKTVTLSDAFVAFSETVPTSEKVMTTQYLELLAKIYLELPKPKTSYKNWPEILDTGLKDLIESPGCWTQVDGNRYFNAYVSDYKTPPEIMVQLAILLPLQDYVEWDGKELPVMDVIKKGLPAFYDKKLSTVTRWLPAAEDNLDAEEEHKKPGIMDAWYLHHPLLNLSRMALKADPIAKKLFLDSIGYAIKVARHFKYQWPVFYKMDTLEVTKAETEPGKGGEKDVAGIYAHVMLQAWELTGKKKFLNEAERAAKTLKGLGFDLFYQANNTAFTSGAMLRLYKITKKQIYLDISYLCLANIFKNVQLWDCNYGYGRNFPSFFALFPLNNAPYTAVYEEQEVFSAFHDFLKHAEGEDILPAANLLITEYIRYLIDRAVYYYPPSLPKDMLEEKPKTGELDQNLWIALEDLHDGWEKSGNVGQEVYGAGNAFGILPRHYIKVPGEEFMIYADYPISLKQKKGRSLSFKISGDEKLSCRMRLLKTGKQDLPGFQLQPYSAEKVIKEKRQAKTYLEYEIPGNQHLSLYWKKAEKTLSK